MKKKKKKKQEAERKAKEEADRKEAERIEIEKKAAKAPDKDKLFKMIESIQMQIPDLKDSNAKAAASVINAKFEAFKLWAKQQIESV